MSLHASEITSAVVRVAGEIPVDITAFHVGTPEQEAVLRMGELLIYVRSAALAERVAQLWRQARPICAALPHVAGTSRLHLPVRVSLVGVIFRLGGEPACTVVSVPARPGVAQPTHVRIQVGPLVWEVCDRAAWHTITKAWATVHRHLIDPPR